MGGYGPIKHAYTIIPEPEQMSVVERLERTAVYCGKYVAALHKDRIQEDPYHGRSREVCANELREIEELREEFQRSLEGNKPMLRQIFFLRHVEIYMKYGNYLHTEKFYKLIVQDVQDGYWSHSGWSKEFVLEMENWLTENHPQWKLFSFKF